MTAQLALPIVIVLAALIALPGAIARRQWNLTVGFAAAGAGVTIQSPPIYDLIDPLLGGWNVTNLAYHLLTVTGIAAFVLLVLTTNPDRDRRPAWRLVVVVTSAAWLVQIALFILGCLTSGWGSADSHLSDKGGTALFVGYAAVLWVALAGLAVAAIVTQRAQTRGRRWSIAKAGTTLVVVGSIIALGWCVNSVTVAVVAVESAQTSGPDGVGPLLALLGGGSVFAGLAVTNLPHAAATVRAAQLELATRALWRRAVAVAPEVVLPTLSRFSLDTRATLYRHWVEIEDAVHLDRLTLSDPEREQVAAMQRMFAPASTPGRPATTDGR